MKWRLQSKLILSFVLVILLPLLVTAAALLIAVPRLVGDGSIQDLIHVNDRVAGIIERIEKQYPYIGNYDAFHFGITPLLAKYNGQLMIIDNTGVLLYDSTNKEASLRREPRDLDIISGFDNEYQRVHPGIYKYTNAVVVRNNSVANAVILLDMQTSLQRLILRTIYHVGGSFLLGLAAVLGLIILFSILISRSILVPLKKLYGAVDQVAAGDVDFRIEYDKDDELGRLCKAFDIMSSRLKESLEKQEIEVKARKELIAGISHDLRTPIASIKGYVEGLQDGIVQDKKMFDRYLGVIADKTNKLDGLIDDLFQFSQLELGEIQMDLEVVDSAWLLHWIFKDYELDFSPPAVNFTIIEPIPAVKILADRRRISQVVDNILQNARRHIPVSGSITAGALVEGNFFKVYVKDNGCGIAKEDMPHIFNRFYRGEKSRSREYGGTGLGLAICKRIIDDHRGEIWADSVKGQGTTFFFTLPILPEK